MSANIQRGVAVITTLLIALGSTGAFAQSPPARPTSPDIYTSDDGLLTIEVPQGAVAAGTDIRAIYRPPEERPVELADTPTRSGFYELLPASQEFSEPVTITRQILLDDLGFDLERDGVPMIPLALRAVDGTWQWLEEQVVRHDLDTGSITVSGKTSHFSNAFGFGGTAFVRETISPDLEATPDRPLRYEVALLQPQGLGANLFALAGTTARPDMAAPGAGVVSGAEGALQFDCIGVGSTPFQTATRVDLIGQGVPILEDLGLPPMTQQLHSSGTLSCLPPDPAVEQIIGPRSIPAGGTFTGVLPSNVDYEAAIRFLRDAAKGTYGALTVRTDQRYRRVFVDDSGYVVFVDESGFFDEYLLLRPGQKPGTMEGMSIGGGPEFGPKVQRIRQSFKQGVDGNRAIDRVLDGKRISDRFLRSIGAKPRQLEYLHGIQLDVRKTRGLSVQDILGLPLAVPIDSPPLRGDELFTPATVGVIDRDQGVWYLVDPILADLSGASVVGGGDQGASGRAQVTFNTGTGRACFDLDIGNSTVSGIRIHQGAAGSNGPIVLDLGPAQNDSTGCVDTTSAAIEDILANLDDFYINVHSEEFPDGAARGQLSGGPLPPFFFGDPDDDPFLGDWDGDGVATPGTYDPDNGELSLRNSNTTGPPDLVFSSFDPGARPIVGDWDGDGADGIGFWDPVTRRTKLYNKVQEADRPPDQAEIEFIFGDPGDDPFGADFDGDGKDSLGTRRGSTFLWRNSLDPGDFDNEGLDFGDPDDEPMFGDWDGDGLDTPGAFRPATSTIFLRNIRSPGIADMEIFTDGFESGDTSAWSSD